MLTGMSEILGGGKGKVVKRETDEAAPRRHSASSFLATFGAYLYSSVICYLSEIQI